MGQAAWFRPGSSMRLPLRPFYALASNSSSQIMCQQSSVNPGCIMELFKMVPPADISATAYTGSPALTVEGWVRIDADAGGVVLSVAGQQGLVSDPSDPCSQLQTPQDARLYNLSTHSCLVALLCAFPSLLSLSPLSRPAVALPRPLVSLQFAPLHVSPTSPSTSPPPRPPLLHLVRVK